MRVLYFFTILFSLTAYGQGDLSGALRSQNQLQRLNFGNLEVPNNQATKTGAINALIETGNKNLLSNSGFEHATYSTGWTTSGTATYSGTTTASEVLSGLKSFKAVASAQTIDLVQDTTLLASSRTGSQMFFRFVAKNTAAGVTACVRKNGVKQTGSNDCLTLSTDGVTKTYELAFLADGTSNGIEIDAASTTGTLIVDDVELSTESSAFVDVAQIGPWISYTPTFTGFGTPTGIQAQYRINGGNLDIRVKFTAGTPSGVEARVGLPSPFVSATTATIPSIQLSGAAEASLIGSVGQNVGVSYAVLVEASVSYVVFSARSSGNTGLSKLTDTNVIGSGVTLSLFASIPVQGLSNKVSTYSQFAVSDVSVENVFSAKVSSTGVVSDENLDWINGNAANPATGRFTVSFNSSIFTVAPNCAVSIDKGSAASSDIDKVPSIFTDSTTANVLVEDTGSLSPSNTGFYITCTKQGADYKAKNVITGSFQGIEKCADPYECTDTFSARFSDSGAIVTQNLDWINGNCTQSPTGNYTCNFRSGIFTVNPSCFAMPLYNPGNDGAAAIHAISTTSIGPIEFVANNSNFSTPFTLICQKQGVDFRPKTAVAGTFLDSVTSPGAGKVSLCSAKISSTGVISDQIGGCFASCTNATTPVCTFTSNYWVSGSVPNCWTKCAATGFEASPDPLDTSTTMNGRCLNASGTAISGDRRYFCHGLTR